MRNAGGNPSRMAALARSGAGKVSRPGSISDMSTAGNEWDRACHITLRTLWILRERSSWFQRKVEVSGCCPLHRQLHGHHGRWQASIGTSCYLTGEPTVTKLS